MKRLTVVASVLLLPTFIVGLYGQNFKHIPELDWAQGYVWSWGLIIVTTIAPTLVLPAQAVDLSRASAGASSRGSGVSHLSRTVRDQCSPQSREGT